MDGLRFDVITRALATGQTRRQALAGIVGALGGVLGLTRVEEVAAACVRPNKKGCKGPKNGKCCPGSVCKGGTKDKPGKCQCKGGTKKCGTKCVNTKTDKNNCGGCGRTCQGQNICKNGVCTSKLGCPAGGTVCTDPNFPNCPGDTSDNCFCFTSVDGIAFCSDISAGDCSTCTSSASCPSGFLCTVFRGVNCVDQCPGQNFCLIATCDGLSGSSTGGGRRRLAAPLLR